MCVMCMLRLKDFNRQKKTSKRSNNSIVSCAIPGRMWKIFAKIALCLSFFLGTFFPVSRRTNWCFTSNLAKMYLIENEKALFYFFFIALLMEQKQVLVIRKRTQRQETHKPHERMNRKYFAKNAENTTQKRNKKQTCRLLIRSKFNFKLSYAIKSLCLCLVIWRRTKIKRYACLAAIVQYRRVLFSPYLLSCFGHGRSRYRRHRRYTKINIP